MRSQQIPNNETVALCSRAAHRPFGGPVKHGFIYTKKDKLYAFGSSQSKALGDTYDDVFQPIKFCCNNRK